MNDIRGVEEILVTLKSNPSLGLLVQRVLLHGGVLSDNMQLMPNVAVMTVQNSRSTLSHKIMSMKRL